MEYIVISSDNGYLKSDSVHDNKAAAVKRAGYLFEIATGHKSSAIHRKNGEVVFAGFGFSATVREKSRRCPCGRMEDTDCAGECGA